jgi:hypothetical protein
VRLPNATDQIRLAPVRALRAVFSGVGQLLLAADRLREEDARQDRESGEDQQDTLATWDGRLSSSVRLISPTGMPVPSSSGEGSAPGGKSEPTSRKRATEGKAERGGKSVRAGGQQERAGQSGKPAGQSGKPTGKPTGKPAGKARAADSARADRPSRTRSEKNNAERVTGTKAGNAGSGRKSARSKTTAQTSRFRSLDLTGNVRMLTDEDIADVATDQVKPSPADAAAHRPTGQTPAAASSFLAVQMGTPSWSDAAPSWSSWSTDASETRAAEPPISGYDELSLASLRARLRHLGTAELRDLLAHERSHANRKDVVTMFERRIAKLAEAADLHSRRLTQPPTNAAAD